MGHEVSVPVKALGWSTALGQDAHRLLRVGTWQQQGDVADGRQGGMHPSEERRVLLDGVTSSQVDHRVLVVGQDALDGVGLQRLPGLIGDPHTLGMFTALRDRLVNADLGVVASANRVHAHVRPAHPVREQAGDGGLADADRTDEHDGRDDQRVLEWHAPVLHA
jgi:hypothetical protein